MKDIEQKPATLSMKSSIAHLPDFKKRQILEILWVIVKAVEPEKVILFGSHARGDWVEDRYVEDRILHEYISDYDVLVITQSGDQRKDYEVQDLIENRCRTRNAVTAIVHDIDFVNKMLSEGHYFFSDIEKEGILIYDADNIPLSARKEMTNAEKKIIAKEYFDQWFVDAQGFLKAAKYCLSENSLNIGVFNLHQAAERTYNAFLLVYAGYKPNTHNLDKLKRFCRIYSTAFDNVFPENTPEEVHLFDLLKRGYVDARYKKDYIITKEELEILIGRVGRLQVIAEEVCEGRIDEFDAPLQPPPGRGEALGHTL